MLGLQMFFALLSVYVGEVDLSSGCLACVADTLMTGASLDPLVSFKVLAHCVHHLLVTC